MMRDSKRVLLEVGKMCKEYRIRIGCTQSDVSRDTGYSEQNISSFETGRTNNMLIFLWYVDKGIFSNTYYNMKYRLNRILRGDSDGC